MKWMAQKPHAGKTRLRRFLLALSSSCLVLTLCLWAVSLWGIVWAPRTGRHYFHLQNGALILKWQLNSMPCELPSDATDDDRKAAASLTPTSRLYLMAQDWHQNQ